MNSERGGRSQASSSIASELTQTINNPPEIVSEQIREIEKRISQGLPQVISPDVLASRFTV